MAIFRIEADTANYAFVSYQNDFVGRDIPRFMGQSLGDSWGQWSGLRVYRIVEAPARFLESDFYGYLRGIAVKHHVWEIFHPLVGNSVEALPLMCPDTELLALNVLVVLDCLDLSNAEYHYSTDRLEYWFCGVRVKQNACRNVPIFKVPRRKHESYIYVSGEFKTMVETNGLRGLRFIEMKED